LLSPSNTLLGAVTGCDDDEDEEEDEEEYESDIILRV
jgi:hypothetical protein